MSPKQLQNEPINIGDLLVQLNNNNEPRWVGYIVDIITQTSTKKILKYPKYKIKWEGKHIKSCPYNKTYTYQGLYKFIDTEILKHISLI
jgi:hypothetical protein